MLFGPAVAAKGFTAELGEGAYWIEGPWFAAAGGATGGDAGEITEAGIAGAMPVEAAGDRGSPAGAPHAVQNFRVPISSAPHFAQ